MSVMSDIRGFPVPRNAVAIWWLGQNGFIFKTPEGTLLSTDLLNRSELGKIAVFSNGKITVENNSGLTLPEFGELKLTGSQIEIRDSISAVAGKINLKSQVTNQLSLQNNIDVAPGVTLSTAGKWVNDSLVRADLSQVLKSSDRQAIWEIHSNCGYGILDIGYGRRSIIVPIAHIP